MEENNLQLKRRLVFYDGFDRMLQRSMKTMVIMFVAAADPWDVQGVRTPALLISVPFLKRTVSITLPGMHKNSPF